MFGYILLNDSNLTKDSKKRLSSYYCSLCFQTKSKYGDIMRLLLRYDVLFPLILFESISNSEEEKSCTNCILHPFTTFNIYKNSNIEYVADINMLLIYYKILDDMIDKNDLKNKILFCFIKNHKTNIRYKFLNNIFEKNISKLSDLEKDHKVHSLDELCDPMGKLMGLLFENMPGTILYNSLEKRTLLYNLGYNIGKWIYIIDAVDDIYEDQKRDNFNPIINSTFTKNFNVKLNKNDLDRISIILQTLLKNCKNITNNMHLCKNNEIIYNYLYKSLPNITMNILYK